MNIAGKFKKMIVAPALTLATGTCCVSMPGTTFNGKFPPLSSDEIKTKEKLQRHVFALAGNIGERNLWKYKELQAAAGYIENSFKSQGYNVISQEYKVNGKTVRNLGVVIKGTKKPDEIIIIGGHYDSVTGSTGANDNASGVAAVLEIARLLAKERFARTIRFVAFVNEEPPFFQTENMGSLVYARRSRKLQENIIAMISIETIGYYSEKSNSQKYPFPFNLFYPSRGNFLAFVGNNKSRGLVRKCIGSFRRLATFPSEGIAVPGSIPGIGWSDHWSFWQTGYEAIMITDTAPFRYKFYHTLEDTPEKILYDRMARVVIGMSKVIMEMAGKD